MKSFIKYLTGVFLAVFISISGCIDEPAAPDYNIIKGRIYNFLGTNYLVSAGEYPIVSTDINGNFETQAISNPFDLVVSEISLFYTYAKFISKFSQVTLKKPQIIFNSYYNYNYYTYYFETYNRCKATIKFPPAKDRKLIAFVFLSEDVFSPSSTSIITDTGEDSVYIEFYLPEEKPE
jgi:hypothetical protein